jgi:hypothetical protein
MTKKSGISKKQLEEWIKNPPQDVENNLKFRLELMNEASDNKALQEFIKIKCADNFEFYFDIFCWTYDPREEKPHKPFILWPAQKEFLKWLEELYQRSQRGEKINVIVDKPRAIGITYTMMTWIDWHYKFHEFSARVGSRKEDYVDKKGDPDTLFYKLDYQTDRQPLWLCGDHNRAYMSMRPADIEGGNPNSIIGESANPNFSRGGRKHVVLFDEFGFWDWSKSSWESAGESTNFRVAVSTPPESGHDSHMYKLLSGEAGKVFAYEFDWTADPRRDENWYKEAQETKSEEEFAREVLKSYEGTTEGKVYAISMRRALMSDVDYNPELPLFVSWDFGLDTVAILWFQKNMQTNWTYLIDCYSNSNKEIDYFVPFITGRVVSSGQPGEKFYYSELELNLIDRHRTWKQDITHYGDPDVRKRNLINKDSVKDHLYREHGIYVQSKPWGGRHWTDMREKTNLLFRRLESNESRCEPALTALRNAKYPERRESSQAQNEPLKPIHDWTSHYRTAFEYFADNEPETGEVRTILHSTNPAVGQPKPAHIIEAERLQAEKDKIAGIRKPVIRTVLNGVSFGGQPNNRHRIL